MSRNAVKPETAKLLRKVAKHILAEPKRIDMRRWVAPSKDDNGPACGTVACIAGWTCLMGAKPEALRKISAAQGSDYEDEDTLEAFRRLARIRGSWDHAAARRLGITPVQAERLFFLSFHYENHAWPPEFEDRYVAARTAQTRAKVAVERIEHFIRTGL